MKLAATAEQGALGLHARSRFDEDGAESEDGVDGVPLGKRPRLGQFEIHLGRPSGAVAEVRAGRGTIRARQRSDGAIGEGREVGVTAPKHGRRAVQVK
jgi:hypothetical protein